MPLKQSSSKKAFSKNVETEMKAGKPQDQSLAIAYNIKRKNNNKKKMAYGGMAEDDAQPSLPMAKPDDEKLSENEYMADHFAKGGMADVDDHYDSIADAIIAKKRKAKMMAEGGLVDIDSNNEEQPNMFDDMNEAALKENYDSDMDSLSQPMDSNEQGRALDDEDEHDMVSQARKKIKSKRM